jgi:predicted DNA-binding protein with PD1-like motif
MKHKLLSEADGVRHFLLVFDTGDEVAAGLVQFAAEQRISHATFHGLGAFERFTIAYFNLLANEYEKTAMDEQVEVMSLIGNIAQFEGKPKLHAHVVLGKRDLTAHGGHLVEGYVRPTLEVSLTAFAQNIARKIDAATGLPLIDIDEAG